MMTGPNKFTCQKPNYLLMNPQLRNTQEKYIDLTNIMSIKSLPQSEKVGIIEPLEFNEQIDYMKPFKSRFSYFRPKRHTPAINWTYDMNIFPVEGYTFAHCQSMWNIEIMTNSSGCSKYTIKYIGKFDAQKSLGRIREQTVQKEEGERFWGGARIISPHFMQNPPT